MQKRTVKRNALQRLAIIRIAMGSYAVIWTLVRTINILDTSRQPARRFDPVGPLWFLDKPLPVSYVVVGIGVVVVAGTAMVFGWRYRLTAPVTAVAFMFITTYRNSWGHIIHTENLISVQLVVLALAPAAVVWSVDSHRDTESDDGWWALKSMAVLATGAYLLAGIAKLRISGMHWIDGDVLLHQIAFDNARKIELGTSASPFAAFFIKQHWLMAPSAIVALVIELGAPLALLKERIAIVWAASVVLLHFAILGMMAILFPYQLLGIALLPLLPVEVAVVRFLDRRRAQNAIAAPLEPAL